jgi:hypothetical protein
MQPFQTKEFRTLCVENFAITQKRIKELGVNPPFPPLEVTRLEGLQIIRENCNELNRCWRVKRGIFRHGLIFASVATYDGKLWYHASFSLKDKIPTYEQTLFVRGVVFCASAKVIQVFPPVTEHYNLHPNCLHLWSCLESDGLPDFRTMGAI